MGMTMSKVDTSILVERREVHLGILGALQRERILNKLEHLLVHFRSRIVRIDTVTSVGRDVGGEVLCRRVQILHIRGDIRARAARGNGVAIAVAEREVLGSGDLPGITCY